MTDELKQWEYDKGYEHGKADMLKVIEDIKADIQELVDWRTKAGLPTEDLQMVLEIIDKHIRGDEDGRITRK